MNMGGGHLAWVKLGLPVKKPVIVHEEELSEVVAPMQKPAEDIREEQNKNELPADKPAYEVEVQVN